MPHPLSLSARRAWIEICCGTAVIAVLSVALRKESVDRNSTDKRTGNVKLTYTPEQSQVAPIITSAFTSQRIVWGDSMLMRWYTNNACRLIDKRGNISFGKYEPKSRKTDGFMAMVAAFVAAVIKQDEMQAADYSSADLPDVYTY